ncbi:hypothetical protein Bbelb_100050 [Branchiostoma belcheri]|nr:hypothetical protein Bbelb_100050 [Branchiostoma belcheri]
MFNPTLAHVYQYPCGVCRRAVKWERADGRRAVCCDSCDTWYHTDCMVKPDIIVGTESWLDPTVGNSEIFPTSYSAYRKDREGRGSGVFIAVKNSIIATHLPDPDCTSELTWVQIQLAHSKTVHIGAYYRPPSADQSDLTSLEQSLTRIRDQSRNSHIWLAGDFNLPTARWNTDTTSIPPQISPMAAIRHQGVLTADPKEKAEALGEQFESVFTKEDTNIIPTLAWFPKGLSCETQLLVTTHDLAHGLDQNLQIDAVVLDFSKAFDTVPHQRLLSKLQYYGIKGHILSWLKAFLTERTQTVVLDGESSKPSRVTSGVPRGTSPTDAQGLQADLDALTEWQDLHISNDMRWDVHIAHATGKANRTLGVIRRNLCHCTSQVKNTCYKALVRPQLEYCASVWDPYTAGGVQAVERVQRRAARMVMNDYARTSSRYPLRGCQVIEQVTFYTHLGVTLHQALCWTEHAQSSSSKARKVLGYLWRLRGKLSREALELAYSTLVRPKLEYASILFSNMSAAASKVLERVQYHAGRLVTGAAPRTPYTDVLHELGWATLAARRDYQRLVIMYKLMSGSVPQHLHPLIPTTRQAQSQLQLRLRNSVHLHIPRCRTNIYKNSFIPYTSRLWNSLPRHITDSPTLIIDPCEDNDCAPNVTVCVPEGFKFSCRCNHGYEGDEKSCVGTAQATKYASIFEGRSAGECRTLCGTSLGRVRDVLRESAIRSAGECGTSSGRVRTSRDGFLASVEGLHATVFEDWTGSGCNIKGAGGFW